MPAFVSCLFLMRGGVSDGLDVFLKYFQSLESTIRAAVQSELEICTRIPCVPTSFGPARTFSAVGRTSWNNIMLIYCIRCGLREQHITRALYGMQRLGCMQVVLPIDVCNTCHVRISCACTAATANSASCVEQLQTPSSMPMLPPHWSSCAVYLLRVCTFSTAYAAFAF